MTSATAVLAWAELCHSSPASPEGRKNQPETMQTKRDGSATPTLSHSGARVQLVCQFWESISRVLQYLSHLFGHEHLNDVFFFNTTEVFPEMRTLLSSLSQLYGIYLKKRIAPGSWAWQARINSQGRTLVGNPHSRDSMLTVAHQTSQQARSQPYSLPWSQKKQHCQLWVPICTGRHSSDTQLEGL